jgi:hypothetical protein
MSLQKLLSINTADLNVRLKKTNIRNTNPHPNEITNTDNNQPTISNLSDETASMVISAIENPTDLIKSNLEIIHDDSSSHDGDLSVIDLNAYLRVQREKQFRNMLKIESQSNNTLSLSINQLHDVEINDLIKMIDIYIQKCLSMLDANDSVIRVCLKDFRLSTYQRPQQAKPELPTETSENQPKIEMNNSIKKKTTINISSVSSMEFLRSALKTGNPFTPIPLEQQVKPSKDNSKNAFIANSMLNFKSTLNIELNRDYFSVNNEMNANSTGIDLFKINVKKKPTEWSDYDYNQLTLDVLLNKRNVNSHRTDKTKNRFLNSRAIFDRLYKCFDHVLKHDFNLRQYYIHYIHNKHHSLNENLNKSQKPPQSHNNNNINNNIKDMIDRSEKINESNTTKNDSFIPNNQDKYCTLKNNQLIINFKLNNGKI